MHNIGSSYLTMQSYGVTVVGAIIVIGGIIGVAVATTLKGKVIWGGISIAGILAIWGSKKMRTHVENNPESSGGYGTIALGLLILGAVVKTVKSIGD